MADRILNIRDPKQNPKNEKKIPPLIATEVEPIMGIYCLSNLNDYSSETGIAKFSDPIL